MQARVQIRTRVLCMTIEGESLMQSVHKVTISISDTLFKFIELYQAENQFKSRSDVINQALKLLQQKQLETDYLEANEEINDDYNLWSGDGDGLDDEAW